jgi:hypothetical protein
MTRTTKEEQMKIGEVPISEIKFDLKARDNITKLLKGLQHIYCTPELREEMFTILENVIPENIDRNNGRPGMELWKIIVLGTLKINCDWSYDLLHNMANNHSTLRQMLGHSSFDDKYEYQLQTLKDNVSLLTPEILDKINQLVVSAGHKIVKKKRSRW